MAKLRVILAAMVTAQILFGFSLTADAAQEVHFSIEESSNTQGMTFGKSEKIIYVLKSSDSGTVIQLFAYCGIQRPILRSKTAAMRS